MVTLKGVKITQHVTRHFSNREYLKSYERVVQARETHTDTFNPPAGLRPRFTSAMGAIWDSYT